MSDLFGNHIVGFPRGGSYHTFQNYCYVMRLYLPVSLIFVKMNFLHYFENGNQEHNNYCGI